MLTELSDCIIDRFRRRDKIKPVSVLNESPSHHPVVDEHARIGAAASSGKRPSCAWPAHSIRQPSSARWWEPTASSFAPAASSTPRSSIAAVAQGRGPAWRRLRSDRRRCRDGSRHSGRVYTGSQHAKRCRACLCAHDRAIALLSAHDGRVGGGQLSHQNQHDRAGRSPARAWESSVSDGSAAAWARPPIAGSA